jgi:lipopolysaccharide/colanic/teichoic acid biosynthesis glycosyltransferase
VDRQSTGNALMLDDVLRDGIGPRIDHVLCRTLDIVVALLALMFFLPVFVLVAALLFVSDPGPIFFAHRRIGKGGKPFACLKFRTMVVDADARLVHLLATDPDARMQWNRDHKLRNDPRITRTGLFVRRSSLDELPQLINVLIGNMSLVGPRPIVPGEVTRYGRYFSDYCSVLPGITGLWQVSGRNNVSYRRRIALDIRYARTRCLAMNLRIIAMTIPAVFAARGSY